MYIRSYYYFFPYGTRHHKEVPSCVGGIPTTPGVHACLVVGPQSDSFFFAPKKRQCGREHNR